MKNNLNRIQKRNSIFKQSIRLSSFAIVLLFTIGIFFSPAFAQTWAEQTDMAYHLFKEGELAAAIDTTTQARTLAQLEFGPQSWQEAMSLSHLAIFHSVNRQKDVAALFLKEFNTIKAHFDEEFKKAEFGKSPTDELIIKMDQISQLKENIYEDEVLDSTFAKPAVDSARVEAYRLAHPKPDPPPMPVLVGPTAEETRPPSIEKKNIETTSVNPKSKPLSTAQRPDRTDASGFVRWLNQ